jgi:chromosome segregation ATPase
LKKKRDRLVEGTKAYLAASKQVEAAQAQRDSVQAEITSKSDKAQSDRDQLFRTNLQNQESRLQLAATASDNQGVAEQKLIAFYRKESTNVKLTEAERLRYQEALATEIDNQKKAVVAASKAQIDLKLAIDDLRIQQAEATPGESDDVKAINNKIKDLRKQRDRFADYSKEWVEYQSQIETLKARLKNLSGSGFSLQDLFKESLRQFQEFGSNVSSNPLTGGQVRGQFAGTLISTILGSQKDRAALGIISVASNTSETNLLLRQLIALVKGEPVPSGTGTITSISVGRKTADSGRLLHRNVGHL